MEGRQDEEKKRWWWWGGVNEGQRRLATGRAVFKEGSGEMTIWGRLPRWPVLIDLIEFESGRLSGSPYTFN